jgi:hypothetical protein
VLGARGRQPSGGEPPERVRLGAPLQRAFAPSRRSQTRAAGSPSSPLASSRSWSTWRSRARPSWGLSLTTWTVQRLSEYCPPSAVAVARRSAPRNWQGLLGTGQRSQLDLGLAGHSLPPSTSGSPSRPRVPDYPKPNRLGEALDGARRYEAIGGSVEGRVPLPPSNAPLR